MGYYEGYNDIVGTSHFMKNIKVDFLYFLMYNKDEIIYLRYRR
jgi:hypothetical protein